jgi:hypothetical protein
MAEHVSHLSSHIQCPHTGSYLGPAAEQVVQRFLDARQQQPLLAARAALLLDSPSVGEGQQQEQQQQQLVRVGRPLVPDDPLYQRFLSGRLPEWEAENPPCGVILPVHSGSSSSNADSHAPGESIGNGWWTQGLLQKVDACLLLSASILTSRLHEQSIWRRALADLRSSSPVFMQGLHCKGAGGPTWWALACHSLHS